jgi:hypothetical protein
VTESEAKRKLLDYADEKESSLEPADLKGFIFWNKFKYWIDIILQDSNAEKINLDKFDLRFGEEQHETS